MLVVGYVKGLRSERRLCQEVHLNLAYRWFCRLGLEDRVPDHSSFSKLRHGKFRGSDIFRHIFERVVAQCISHGWVGGQGFAVDASLIRRPTGHCKAMHREAAPMSRSRAPVVRINGMRLQSIHPMPRGRCVNISTLSTKRLSALQRP
jgi:IS5 family transposase